MKVHYRVAFDPYGYFGRCESRLRRGATLAVVASDVTCKSCLMALAARSGWDMLTNAQRTILCGGRLR